MDIVFLFYKLDKWIIENNLLGLNAKIFFHEKSLLFGNFVIWAFPFRFWIINVTGFAKKKKSQLYVNMTVIWFWNSCVILKWHLINFPMFSDWDCMFLLGSVVFKTARWIWNVLWVSRCYFMSLSLGGCFWHCYGLQFLFLPFGVVIRTCTFVYLTFLVLLKFLHREQFELIKVRYFVSMISFSYI